MKRASLSLALLVALFATACSSSGGPSAYGESEEKIQLDVTVTYRERMLLPPGSTIRASLFDETHELKPAVSSNAVAARQGRGVPAELVITYPIDQLDQSHEYVIRAEITDAEGNVLFMTDGNDEPVKIDPNETEPQKFEIVVKRAPGD